MTHKFFLVFIALLFSACGTAKTQQTSESTLQEKPRFHYFDSYSDTTSPSKVEIDYTLGRDHYLLVAEAHDQSTYASSSIDGQIIEKGKVMRDQYSRFLKNSIKFMNLPTKHTHDASRCRNPYKITIRVETETHSQNGCRLSDNGQLSKLIKEGEFLLLYSKN